MKRQVKSEFRRNNPNGRIKSIRRFLPQFEALEPRHLLAARPVITEFVAANDNGLLDEDGDDPDWIEVLNFGDDVAELRGWYLTDDANDLTKWRFPELTLPVGESIVVFASNKDRDIAGRELHTNFRLSSRGEYLALVEPDGVTIASEFGDAFPQQVTDVSYGIPTSVATTTLVQDGALARVLIPTDDTLDPVGNTLAGTWLDPELDDRGSGWFDATTGIGFEANAGTETLLADSVADYSATGVQGHNSWYYGYYNRSRDTGGYAVEDFTQFPDNYFTGVVWDWPDGNPPHTLVGQRNMNPNGVNSGDEHWAMRRYISEAAGSLEITWAIRKSGLAAGGTGVSGHVYHNGELVDEVTISGTSTSFTTRTVVVDGAAVGDTIDFAVSPRGTDLLPLDTMDASQLTATIHGITGVGGNISPGGNVQTEMLNVGSSAYLRIPFEVDDPSSLTTLQLNMRYDDGFIAYLNGQPIAAEGTDVLANASYLNTATVDRDATSANSIRSFDVTSDLSLLRPGENVLMIHGMNFSADNGDFVIRPQLVATTLQLDFENPRYFVAPTPGDINGTGSETVGPLFLEQQFTPLGVTESDFVSVGDTARVLVPTNSNVDDVWQETDFDDAAGGWFDATSGVGYEDSSQLPTTEIADSRDDWSSSGSQGADNWHYGYYDESADGDGIYSSGDFRQFPNNYFVGVVWDWPNGNPPHTLIGNQNMVPNGSDAGPIHWPVRRYVSEASGSLNVRWNLVKSGLAVGGNGVTGRVFHNGVQVDTIGLTGTNTSGITHNITIPNVQVGDAIDFALDPRGTDGSPNGSSDTSRMSVTINGQSSIRGLIDSGGDIQTEMQGVSSSAYLRLPFNVEAGINYDTLTLAVNYDDGFIAYLNGQQIAARNVSGSGFSATSSSSRNEIETLDVETIDVSQHASLLNVGANVLAIHAVNANANDPDFAIVPQLSGSGPTGQAEPGTIPMAGAALIITSAVAETFSPVDNVKLHYHVMFGEEASVVMVDDGSGNDAAAGDGIYTGTVPGGLTEPGEMVRWYMTASDTEGNDSRFPVFNSPVDSEEYFGTIAYDPSIESSRLPVMHWFVENPSRANTTNGTRSSLFYDGEFYDNVRFDIHGQSTRGGGFPKKSYDVDFTRDHRFRWTDDVRRMKDFNLLTNYADKGKFRNELAYEVWGLAGSGTHLAEPVRVQQNGEFFAIYDFVEDGDDRYLERIGLDPDGAFYKMYNNGSTVSGNQKITRRDEDFSDLEAILASAQLSGTERRNFFFDNIDIPSTVNFLAAQVVNANIDCCHKNYYMYRDTNGTGQWYFLPWDVDLSFGRLWTRTNNYFDDIIKIDTGVPYGHMVVTSALFNTPDFREMYLRRVRTLMDLYLQPPGTPSEELYFERRLDEILAALDPTDDDPNTGTDDADLDFQKWGTWGNNFTLRDEMESVKTVFLPQRREFLYNMRTVGNGGEIPGAVELSFTDVTAEDAPVSAWVPTDNSLGLTWTDVSFNDDDWLHGNGGVGYERGNGYQQFIDVDLLSVNPPSKRIDTNGDGTNENNSVYVRYPFTFDAESPENLSLRIRIDDGFVAYLNGTEVARGNFSGVPTWNSTANGNGVEASANFADFDISQHTQLLQQGQNVLAIHGLNQASSSSDMIIHAKLSSVSEVASSVNLSFGAYDANPDSGDQDQEFVELKNNGSSAVDLSNWQIVGGIQHEIEPGTVIPGGGSLYLTPDLLAFRARPSGPSGGQGLFVQQGYNGHLSNFGETIELLDLDGTVVASLTTIGTASDAQNFLRVTEIMYNPAAPTAAELAVDPLLDNDDFEFVEVMNTSTNITLDLNGVVVSQGFVDPLEFTGSGVESLAPGERLVLVSNVAAFELRYADVILGESPAPIQYVGSLSNGGERIKIDDANGSTVVDFSYDDGSLWPQAADGVGASLESLIAESPQSPTDLDDKYYSWRSSETFGGTPLAGGSQNPVVISEIRANTDDPGQLDAIELHNTASFAMNIGGWYLSDSAADLLKFEIPAGTVVGGGDYIVFDENDFNPTPLTPGPHHFALDGTEGDDVWLVQPDDNGGVELFVDDVHFRGTFSGQTLGLARHGNDRFAPLTRDTLGCANSQPLVDDVFISTIHYWPSLPSAAALAIHPDLDGNDLEYLIIENRRFPQSLDGWRIRGGIEFDEFPETALAASIRVLSFDPNDPANASRREAFLTHHGLPESTPLIGGYSGSLNNSGEQLRLERPGTPPADDPLQTPFVTVDEVVYDDQHPWPAPTAGDPIVRRASMFFGNDGDHWTHASALSTGGDVTWGDFNGDDLADADDLDLLIDAVNRGSQNADYVLSGTVPLPVEFEIDDYIENVLGTIRGDANLDQTVNASDLNQVGIHWQRSGCGGWAGGDFNGDNIVNVSDLNTLALNWQRSVGVAADALAARTPRAPLDFMVIAANIRSADFSPTSMSAGEVDQVVREYGNEYAHLDMNDTHLRRLHFANRMRRTRSAHSSHDGLKSMTANLVDLVLERELRNL